MALAGGIGFADTGHGNGREHAGINALALQDALHGKGIHDGGHDAHVVGGDAVHALRCAGHAAEDIAAANHQRHLGTGLDAAITSSATRSTVAEVDAEGLLPHQHFARDLQKDALVGDGDCSPPPPPPLPSPPSSLELYPPPAPPPPYSYFPNSPPHRPPPLRPLSPLHAPPPLPFPVFRPLRGGLPGFPCWRGLAPH